MARILVTGIVALDIVNNVDHYPAEDEEIRVLAQEIRLGGNGANTATVLTQHGHETEFVGTLARDSAAEYLLEVMHSRQINTQYCPRFAGTTPTSYITLSQQNGSRTIVHHRDLAELSAADFPAVAVADYDWLHFEGRNVTENRNILSQLQAQKTHQSISLEIEKPRQGIESLFNLADVLLFSRAYACSRQFDNPESFLKSVQKQFTGRILICSWGETGAAGIDNEGQLYSQPALPPERVIDSVGAGDTFNAAIIHALINNKTIPAALVYACELAGRKVGQQGLDKLVKRVSE